MREAGNSGAAIAHGRSAVELGALAMAENGNAVPYLDARTRLGEALFFSDRHASLAEFEAVVEALPRYGLEGTRLHRSEEHTSELQSLMRNSYADFCLNKKKG